MTKDMLLSEIRRSLQATHPDRAEEMIAQLEKWMPGHSVLPVLPVLPVANLMGMQVFNQEDIDRLLARAREALAEQRLRVW